RSGHNIDRLTALTYRGHLELIGGAAAAAIATLTQAHDLIEKAAVRYHLIGLVHPLLALALIDGHAASIGDIAPLVARGLAYTKGRQMFRAHALMADAALAGHCGRTRRALRKLDRARAFAEAQGHCVAMADIDVERGRLLLGSRATADGTRHLERAAADYERF